MLAAIALLALSQPTLAAEHADLVCPSPEFAVHNMNNLVLPHLQGLLKTRHFRYQKVDVVRRCFLTPNGALCDGPYPACPASVDRDDCMASKSNSEAGGCKITIESLSGNGASLHSHIDKGSWSRDSPPLWSVHDSSPSDKIAQYSAPLSDVAFHRVEADVDFLHYLERSPDNLLSTSDGRGVYIDLVVNPERYTGYTGPNPQTMWKHIYATVGGCAELRTLTTESGSLVKVTKEEALKLTTFLRNCVSAVHSSISIHIASEFYCSPCKRWVARPDLFYEKVGCERERVEVVHTLYCIMVRAAVRIAETYVAHPLVSDDVQEDRLVDAYLNTIVHYINRCSTCHTDLPVLGRRCRAFFRTAVEQLMSITGCLACQKCRLWSKVQFMGLSTALKTLATQNTSLNLTRTEVLCFFQLFARISESVLLIRYYITSTSGAQYGYDTKYPNIFLLKDADSPSAVLEANHAVSIESPGPDVDPNFHKHLGDAALDVEGL